MILCKVVLYGPVASHPYAESGTPAGHDTTDRAEDRVELGQFEGEGLRGTRRTIGSFGLLRACVSKNGWLWMAVDLRGNRADLGCVCWTLSLSLSLGYKDLV